MAMVCSSAAVTPASGQIVRRVVQIAGGANVSFPINTTDSSGNQWMIYPGGMLRQMSNTPQGNYQIYSQGAVLTIDGAQVNMGNQAQSDPKTGAVVVTGAAGNAGMTVTRHILVNKEDGYVRYIDVLKNTQKQDKTVSLMLQSSFNYGINNARMIDDSSKKNQTQKDQNIAWVAQVPVGIPQAIMEMYAGKGAKIVPSINNPPGNNFVQATLQLKVPAGKEVAVMHLHSVMGSQDEATRFVRDLKESKLMATIPAALRGLIVNFKGGDNLFGDYELLRGDLFDVVELRGGDQIRGNLRESAYTLDTFYGKITLPVANVIGLINVGAFRPRQLIVLRDGEIFGGRMDRDAIAVQLSSGQTTNIPLGQISRVGYRKEPGEKAATKFTQPMVMLRSGDRVAVALPTELLTVATRYGELHLPASSIAAIVFQSEDNGVHTIYLTDGSHFAGLAMGSAFEMKLLDAGAGQVVKFPATAISRMQFTPQMPEVDDDSAPTLQLATGDLLVGALEGALKLDTAFDTLTIDARQIKSMTHAGQSATDVQVELWDETCVSGRLQEQELACRLKSGGVMKAPVGLIDQYTQPIKPGSPPVENKKGPSASTQPASSDAASEAAQPGDEAETPVVLPPN